MLYRKNLIRVAGVAALLAGMMGVLCVSPVTAQSRWGANYFPNIELTTQEGKKVHFYDDLIKGKIVAIDLIYTTCQYSCPLETARLAQVLVNLLHNASKYTAKEGHIGLTARREGDGVVLRVKDSGEGIALEMLSRVFDPFTQGEGSRGG